MHLTAQDRFVTMLEVREQKGVVTIRSYAGGSATALSQHINTVASDEESVSKAEEVITVS